MMTTYRFDHEVILPGDCIHRRSYSAMGWAIRAALPGCWGNHDAPWIPVQDRDYIGDAQWPRARLTDYRQYESDMDAGKCECRVYRPSVSTYEGIRAAAWWRGNVNGRPYDLAAYPSIIYQTGVYGRLAIKMIFGTRWPKQLEWAWYCTEGYRDMFLRGAKKEIYNGKDQPTPFSSEKMLMDGWADITPRAIVVSRIA